jgi:hypothetical protein
VQPQRDVADGVGEVEADDAALPRSAVATISSRVRTLCLPALVMAAMSKSWPV